MGCIAEDHTHAKAADDLRKGKYTTGWIIVSTDRPECCRMGHLSSEGKGSPACGGAGAETEDDEEGATPTHWNLRAIDSCGLRLAGV